MRKNRWNRTIFAVMIFLLAERWTSTASAATNLVADWNVIAIQARMTAGQGSIPASRTLAIVHLAIHDALNAIDSRYERYAFTGTAPKGTSVDAAVATAARDALVGAIAVGPLPFPNFGTPVLQAAAAAAD